MTWAFHFIFLEHDLVNCRTISRRDMRNTVNKYMTVVLNETPLTPRWWTLMTVWPGKEGTI